MVNIKSEVKGGICDAYVEVNGSVRQIVEELGTAVQQMHDTMRRNDETHAAEFRYLFTQLVTDEHSPLWDEPDLVPSDKAKAAGDLIADMRRRGLPMDIIRKTMETMEAMGV
mgnify:FL=1